MIRICLAILFLFLTGMIIGYSQENNLQKKAKEAQEYCKEKGLNTDYCILIDMNIHSGKKRLFVYQFKTHTIVESGLCSHGCCDHEWGEDQSKIWPKFSNVHESHCSSLGKYKIGARGYSNWGIHVNYKMHGLEATNSNAFDRIIVLHSWEMVTDAEVYPEGTAEGWGCPAVSNAQMRRLDTLLQKSDKPVLMWIYK